MRILRLPSQSSWNGPSFSCGPHCACLPSDFLSSSPAEHPPKHPSLSDYAPSVDDDPEIGFSVTASDDRDTGKPVSHAVCGEGARGMGFRPCASLSFSMSKPSWAVLASGDSSRAPPFSSV